VDYDDPGWRHILKPSTFLLPSLGLRLMRRREGQVDGITGMRTIYIGLLTSLWLFAVVLLFIVPSNRWFAVEGARWVALVVAVA
jgi:uncharacterized protein YybS (DUF2232 family)